MPIFICIFAFLIFKLLVMLTFFGCLAAIALIMFWAWYVTCNKGFKEMALQMLDEGDDIVLFGIIMMQLLGLVVICVLTVGLCSHFSQ